MFFRINVKNLVYVWIRYDRVWYFGSRGRIFYGPEASDKISISR